MGKGRRVAKAGKVFDTKAVFYINAVLFRVAHPLGRLCLSIHEYQV